MLQMHISEGPQKPYAVSTKIVTPITNNTACSKNNLFLVTVALKSV